MSFLINLFTSIAILSHFSFAAKELPPAPRLFVYNESSELTPVQVQALSDMLEDFQTTTKHQFVIAVFDTLEGEDVEDFTNRLFRAWGIGSKENNDGLLLVVAIKDRKFRLEVGYGLEGEITDNRAMRFTQEQLIPSFKNYDYFSGFKNLIQSLKSFFIERQSGSEATQPTNLGPIKLKKAHGVMIFVILIFLFISRSLLWSVVISFVLLPLVWAFILLPVQVLLFLLIFSLSNKTLAAHHSAWRRHRGWDLPGGGGWGGGSWGGSSGGFLGGGGSSGGGGFSGRW